MGNQILFLISSFVLFLTLLDGLGGPIELLLPAALE